MERTDHQNQSLDPRVNRLPDSPAGEMEAKAPLDQFGTFEVFVQPKDGKPFQHEGAVHAPDIELAFVLAKEAFTRRFTCSSLCVAETRNVFVSNFTEGDASVFDTIKTPPAHSATGHHSFEIYYLFRRGKQHIHAGSVMAANYEDALLRASQELHPSKPVYNIWAIRSSDIRFTHADEKDLWITLPEKKFRDAAAYKAGDKLTAFLQRN